MEGKFKWVTAWSYGQRRTTFTRWENQKSFEIKIKNNIKGEKIRFRFSNWYGFYDTDIEKCYVVCEGKKYNITYKNNQKFTVSPAEDLISDDIEVITKPAGEMTVYVEFKDYKRPESGNTFDNGVCMILQSVDIYTDSDVCAVGFFGDSITHRRKWTNPLTESWYKKYPGKIAAYEVAIDGSRILSDSPAQCHETLGYRAIKRFNHDILGNFGITHIFISLGINDLSYEDENKILSVENMINEMKKITSICEKQGIKTIGMTITPMEYTEVYDIKRNKMRMEINEIIKSGNIFDDVADASGILGKADGSGLKEGFGCEDGIHLTDMAGKCLSEYILQKTDKLIFNC